MRVEEVQEVTVRIRREQGCLALFLQSSEGVTEHRITEGDPSYTVMDQLFTVVHSEGRLPEMGDVMGALMQAG